MELEICLIEYYTKPYSEKELKHIYNNLNNENTHPVTKTSLVQSYICIENILKFHHKLINTKILILL